MKVKVPEQIKVSSMVYDVTLVDNLERDFKLLGQCLTGVGVITIDPKTPEQVKAVTLLHEIVHAINDIYCCSLNEGDIERLAHGLADVLRNSFSIEFDWSVEDVAK